VTTRTIARVAGLCAATLALASCGEDSPEATEPRTIDVVMTDHRFEPAAVRVERGEFVIFRFTNEGAVRHEAVIGDAMFQQGHEDHQHMGSDTMVNAILLEPGEQGQIPYRFDAGGDVIIGCHEADHWQLGMSAAITVASG
jgi:uncharacterized cupredoxin-like copper-binding protein